MLQQPLVAVGVDIGGRSAKLALVRNDGEILHRDQRPLDSAMPVAAILETLAEGIIGIDRYAGEQGLQPVGAGVVMPGYVDEKKQRVELVANLPTLNGTRFPLDLADAVPLDVQFDTDGNAATLGEYHFGGGRGVRRLLVAALGTGIGGGVVIDGRLLRIRNHTAGSLGHIMVNPDGPKCGCGARGCLETFASARGFEAAAADEAKEDPRSALAKLRDERGKLSIAEIIDALKTGDVAAGRAVNRCARWLAAGISTWCSIYSPNRILLGGGVASIGEPLIFAVREQFRAIGQPYAYERVTIDLAALGNDAGVIGAASLWF
jgi:glucokinase